MDLEVSEEAQVEEPDRSVSGNEEQNSDAPGAPSSINIFDSCHDHSYTCDPQPPRVSADPNVLRADEVAVPYFDMQLSESESGDSDFENSETANDASQPKTTKSVKPLPPSASGRTRRRTAEAAMIILQDLSDDDDDALEVSKKNKRPQTFESEIDSETASRAQEGIAFSTIDQQPAGSSPVGIVLTCVEQENVDLAATELPDVRQSSNCKTYSEGASLGCASSDYNPRSESDNGSDEYFPSEVSDFMPSDEPQTKRRKKGWPKAKTKQAEVDDDYLPEDENVVMESGLEKAPWMVGSLNGENMELRYKVDYNDCTCLVCGVHHSDRSSCILYNSELQTFPNSSGEKGEELFGSESLPKVLDLFPSEDGHSKMVAAKEKIPSFTVFGPLVGEEILIYAIEPDDDLTDKWVVVDDDDKVTCYSTANENRSNWARYLNPSHCFADANLMAISKNKKLYFVTIGDIEPEEPLLVWQDEHVGLSLWTKRRRNMKLKCLFTKVTFPTPFHFRMHYMIYHDLRHNGKIFRHNAFCHVCNASVLTSAELTEHCDTLHGQLPWKCSLCNKFLPVPHMRGHLRYCRQNPKREKVVCPICSRDFSHPTFLRNHILSVHSGIRQDTCEYCGKQFSARGLSRHIFSVHHKQQPHVCDQCGKCFSQNANLKVHMLTHSGRKPFQCGEEGCTRAYTTKQCLQSHYRRAHMYTDDNMPEIIRTVAFTFEDYATRSGRVSDSEEKSPPNQSITCNKQTKPKANRRKGKSPTPSSSSDEDEVTDSTKPKAKRRKGKSPTPSSASDEDTDYLPLNRRKMKRTTAKKSAKRKTPASKNTRRKSKK